MTTRHNGRRPDQLRPIKITPKFLTAPAGSCLIEMGNTRVICSAMLEESVPPFLKGSGQGWLTAEYSMLPASSPQRINRERSKIGGRTQEIQRLIGRSLRNCVDLKAMGERSWLIDCDVIDADGGTRTASITGSYVALVLGLRAVGIKTPSVLKALRVAVSAISVGIVKGTPVLDLDYIEDKGAEVDMNVVKTSANQFVEVQGTAEAAPFDKNALDALLALADKGTRELFEIQNRVLESL